MLVACQRPVIRVTAGSQSTVRGSDRHYWSVATTSSTHSQPSPKPPPLASTLPQPCSPRRVLHMGLPSHGNPACPIRAAASWAWTQLQSPRSAGTFYRRVIKRMALSPNNLSRRLSLTRGLSVGVVVMLMVTPRHLSLGKDRGDTFWDVLIVVSPSICPGNNLAARSPETPVSASPSLLLLILSLTQCWSCPSAVSLV